jgi:hypothetical protein
MLACRASLVAVALLLATTIPAHAQKCEGACASACESSTSDERTKNSAACDATNLSQIDKTRCLADAQARNRALLAHCIASKEAEMKK